MKKGSLGIIETWGFTPAVEAADTGLKAANVRLLACALTRPALMTVAFTGDVAAVRTAVDAGSAAAARVGRVVSTHVIARPDRSLIKRFAATPASPRSPVTASQAPGQGKTRGGMATPEATQKDRLPITEKKRAASVKVLPSSSPARNTTDQSSAMDEVEKKIPSNPKPDGEAAIETRHKKPSAPRSKPTPAQKQVPKKKPKSASKTKAFKKKPPSKAPE